MKKAIEFNIVEEEIKRYLEECLKGEIVGFYNGREKDDNTFEIGNICIKPEYQNKGFI